MCQNTGLPPKKLREDVLVSVGMTAIMPTEDGLEALRHLSVQLNAHFRYWEILVIADAEEAANIAPLFNVVPNLRLLKVRVGTSTYRRRFVLASEAIGDVLVMSTGPEATNLDLVTMIETSINEASLVISRRRKGNLLDPLIGVLGKASGFHVSTREMQTVVYPRSMLEMLAARPDKDLALRFAPRDASVKITETLVPENLVLERRGLRGTGRRLALIQKLMVNLAPRVLGYLSILSALVAFAALLFVCYVVGVWIFFDAIQAGWITTSLLLSGTAAFLGLAVFCLASGLQMIIDLVSPDMGRDVIEERSTVDLFSEVMTELNVDYDPNGIEAAQPPEKK
ncbi:hypothetical protein [Thalassospira sp. MCCC 1A01428]|uniref:hypothetical protein n=1 Tax=Thalassospira sp. MCCC 1A01428 TaxID=1470575 RepID=UPI000A1F89E9|nr:hypothetical protein [Thalassospira sp. MCCC 1A01428]OSQ34513.1 hypothetical protein THS27_25290 [Thalassospira sp. MCCC 1A01428]